MQFGPEIEKKANLRKRSHFFPWALGGRDAHGPDDNPKIYTLDTLMRLNGGSLPLTSTSSYRLMWI